MKNKSIMQSRKITQHSNMMQNTNITHDRNLCRSGSPARRRRNYRRQAQRKCIFLCLVLTLFVLTAFIAVGQKLSFPAVFISRNPSHQMAELFRNEQTGSFNLRSQPDPDPETLQALQELAGQDPRIQTVIDHAQSYPEVLLQMLAKNLDMLDFVLDYPEKQGQVFADTIGEVKRGEIPLLLQYDQRWGYGAYGDSSVAVSGCGPACLAMVIAGLTGDNSITPYDVAQYADRAGYYVSGSGTAWSLMSRGSAHFGLIGEELPLSQSSMESTLGDGCPVICSMRPGDFTTAGHFIVITGTKNGKFTVNDPNSTQRSNQLWDYETLQPQINNLWAFRVK